MSHKMLLAFFVQFSLCSYRHATFNLSIIRTVFLSNLTTSSDSVVAVWLTWALSNAFHVLDNMASYTEQYVSIQNVLFHVVVITICHVRLNRGLLLVFFGMLLITSPWLCHHGCSIYLARQKCHLGLNSPFLDYHRDTYTETVLHTMWVKSVV